ncbi:hypothetical protein GOBAR_DD11258 [Gossypium barbadense]|nr:hypothetical protein GOBAR_DD11258 [Gossypium barbadense]
MTQPFLFPRTGLGMNHHDLQAQRREMKHKGRNVVWSIAMDKCLIEALAVQAKNGNKIDKCFNENAYTAACIAAHPDAKGFRGKQIEMYDELKIVCGNYQAPSRWAKMKDGSHPMGYKNFEEDSASFVSPSSDDLSDTDGTESYSGQPEYLHEGSQDPPVMEPLRQLPKRPRESDVLQEAMLAVASSIRRLADAMDQSKTAINPSELLQAVLEIDGLEEAKQMYAFEYLNANPIKARAFMTYNVRMRKMYLFRQ